jgi:TolB-like protein
MNSFGSKIKVFYQIALFAAVTAVAACSPYQPAFKGVGEDMEAKRDVAYYTYVASDKLIRQLRGEISYDTPLLVGTVSNINKMETTNPLGRTITEHMSTRFVQRGFTISEMKLRNSVNIQDTFKGAPAAGEFLLSRDVRAVAGEHKAASIISGMYSVGDEVVLVTIKVIDVATGHIQASTDYKIPRDNDVDLLLGSDGTTGFFEGPMPY